MEKKLPNEPKYLSISKYKEQKLFELTFKNEPKVSKFKLKSFDNLLIISGKIANWLLFENKILYLTNNIYIYLSKFSVVLLIIIYLFFNAIYLS